VLHFSPSSRCGGVTRAMSTPASPRPRYRFGLFEANPANGELRKNGVRVRLQDQPFRLLCLLLERAGEVVSKEELRDKIWHADTGCKVAKVVTVPRGYRRRIDRLVAETWITITDVVDKAGGTSTDAVVVGEEISEDPS